MNFYITLSIMKKKIRSVKIVDRTDIQILTCLQENARMNASTIAERVNLSTSAVIERMRKMENSGCIERYTAIFSESAMGRDVSAFISVGMEHPKYVEGFVSTVNGHKDIIQCCYMAGDFDFLLHVVTASTRTLTDVLEDIKRIPGVSKTRLPEMRKVSTMLGRSPSLVRNCFGIVICPRSPIVAVVMSDVS